MTGPRKHKRGNVTHHIERDIMNAMQERTVERIR